MTEVRNLYLNKCPLEVKVDLKKLLETNMWIKDTNTFKREFPIQDYTPPAQDSRYSREECRCNVSMPGENLYLEGARQFTTTSENKKYVCGLKIWNNPELAKKLENYFREKNMLVEAFDSDV